MPLIPPQAALNCFCGLPMYDLPSINNSYEASFKRLHRLNFPSNVEHDENMSFAHTKILSHDMETEEILWLSFMEEKSCKEKKMKFLTELFWTVPVPLSPNH